MEKEQLKKLITDVFAPQTNEQVVVLVDIPHDNLIDNPYWSDRRIMAAEWLDACRSLGLRVMPLVSYLATGANNADLPETGYCVDQVVNLKESLLVADIVIAMTTYSATAPLAAFVRSSQNRLRVASMPGVLPRMQNTALAVDYPRLVQKVAILNQRLSRANAAQWVFSSGHKMFFDLRYRIPQSDDGLCTKEKAFPLINLPSGEAYIVPYEGERAGEPSMTNGEIPIASEAEVVVLRVQNNRIMEVVGGDLDALRLRQCFEVDAARRNIAEMGLGCNDRAVVTGVVLEDEKAGPHWAYGRSEHLGGTVGPQSFSKAANVLHKDIVYAAANRISVKSITLFYNDQSEEVILRDGQYTVF